MGPIELLKKGPTRDLLIEAGKRGIAEAAATPNPTSAYLIGLASIVADLKQQVEAMRKEAGR